tara:strand:- start:2942 stop:4840 length:1899 start_codon:yes stop_codon:yes gene_type:complete
MKSMANSKGVRQIVQLVFLTFFLSFCGPTFGQEEKDSNAPKTISALQTAIEKVLKDSGTPAVGLAMVEGDSTIWVAGLGKANIENDVVATEKTMFRIGSTSKMFVSLAILKLQEEGRVNLKDKVRNLIPEIEFENPWSETAPILVEHLLEHTTGWDDIHLTEYALNEPGLSLKAGLDFHPHSRQSRWMPGTRMSYCNSGPPVAAYIVEKITGQSFENYIAENFFKPMRMETMTYFESDSYKRLGATLYIDGEPQEYWNISVRPSGAINASAKDMVNLIKFFVGRGKIDSLQLISESLLKRMETPFTTSGAKAGLQHGYGLSNYTSTHKSFVYQGHNGGVNGGLTDFAYLPNHKMGYVVMINNSNGGALKRITDLIRDFQTSNLPTDEEEYNTDKVISDGSIDGYYAPINPRTQLSSFLEKIMAIQHIDTKKNLIYIRGILGGSTKTMVPLSDGSFASSENGRVELIKVIDPLAGEVIHMNTTVLKRVSPIRAYGQLVIGGLWILYSLAVVIFGTIWFLVYAFGKIPKKSHIGTYFIPYLTSLLFIMVVVLFIVGSSNPFESFGKPSLVSVSIMILTICTALAAIWSVVTVIKSRNIKLTRYIYWHLVILTSLNLVATCYFTWHGLIGIQIWA